MGLRPAYSVSPYGPQPHHHDWFSVWSTGYPGMCTTFSAVPVLPAIGTGKEPKTPEEVPIEECVASYRPSLTTASALGSTPLAWTTPCVYGRSTREAVPFAPGSSTSSRTCGV